MDTDMATGVGDALAVLGIPVTMFMLFVPPEYLVTLNGEKSVKFAGIDHVDAVTVALGARVRVVVVVIGGR